MIDYLFVAAIKEPRSFIQDGIKFPDLIHALKPEPHNEIPQAQSAHDTFWDFISLSTESAHMIMWLMSDRAIPRSLRMMEGFGVHTFRLIDKKGVSRFVKFHWKPVLGMHSILWDEALKISGADPDFHRRDLFEAIESGAGPQWELGVQVVEEADEFKFGFDLLDPTKLIPEELVPIQMLGKMTLNRNPENYFSETEQVAFCVSHLVPGIDVTNDPLMQARLFSYLDTQLSRLGGPNFHELPINKSIAPVVNNQRDGHMRSTINPGRAAYEPNSLGGGCPFQAGAKMGGFVSFPEPVDGAKVRDRSDSFRDHFSQATMFYNSQTPIEQEHIIEALRFELGKCEFPEIRERMVGVLEQIDAALAKGVADGLGIKLPVKLKPPMNRQVPADADAARYQPTKSKPNPKKSPALSIIGNLVPGVKTRKVAILVADGFDAGQVKTMINELTAAGAVPKIVATHGGMVDGMKVDFALNTVKSVLFDAIYIPGGQASVATLQLHSAAALFVLETYKHCKAICASGEGAEFVQTCLIKAGVASRATDKVFAAANGVVISEDEKPKAVAAQFIEAMSQHRTWNRVKTELVIA